MSDQKPPDTDPVSTPASRKLPIRLLIAGAVVLVIAAGVATWLILGSESVKVTGTLTLRSSPLDQNILGIPGECRGYNAYNDVAEGASVTIRDASGKVIAATKLQPGKPGAGDEGPVPRECTFSFTANDVPASDFYGIEVSRRGSVQFSRQQAAAGNVHLQLGE